MLSAVRIIGRLSSWVSHVAIRPDSRMCAVTKAHTCFPYPRRRLASAVPTAASIHASSENRYSAAIAVICSFSTTAQYRYPALRASSQICRVNGISGGQKRWAIPKSASQSSHRTAPEPTLRKVASLQVNFNLLIIAAPNVKLCGACFCIRTSDRLCRFFDFF